jgi:hypothetical protein
MPDSVRKEKWSSNVQMLLSPKRIVLLSAVGTRVILDAAPRLEGRLARLPISLLCICRDKLAGMIYIPR